MRLCNTKQRMVRHKGRGSIGNFFMDLVTNQGYLDSISKIGRNGLELRRRGFQTLTPLLKDFYNSDIGQSLVTAGTAYAGNKAGEFAGQYSDKRLKYLDGKVGSKNTDRLITGIKTGMKYADESGMSDSVLKAVDKKLKLPANVKRPAKNIGDLITQSISNATDDRGRAIPNIEQVIKDPEIIKRIPKEAFAAARDAGYKPPQSLSNLLAGEGSRRPGNKTTTRKPKKGEGLFLPGTSPGRNGAGLMLPGRGLSGKGISYI